MSEIRDRINEVLANNQWFSRRGLRESVVSAVAPEIEQLDVMMKANARLIDEQYALIRAMSDRIEALEERVNRPRSTSGTIYYK